MELSKLNNNINFYKIHLREFQTSTRPKKKKRKKEISTRPTFSRTPLANYQGMGR